MRNSELTDRFLPDPPMTERLVFERHDGVLYTNVPHVVRHHSPSGFEWGYMGSGPADLALNVCENVLRQIGYTGPTVKCWDGEVFDAAYMMHQDFKFGWIAPLPRAGWELEYAEVRAWVEDWLTKNHVQVNEPEMAA